jgi:membrane protease YdiL (CAAX protease family)
MISEHVNWRKVGLYLVFAFGISWTSALILYASGIPLASVPGIVVLALTFMPAPAVAAWIVQKKIFGDPLGVYGLRLRGTRLRGLLASIAVVWLLALGTLGLVSLLGNTVGWTAAGRVSFDSQQIARQIQTLSPSRDTDTGSTPLPDLPPPMLLFTLLLVGGTISGVVVNAAFALGEELGWRGLLQTELKPLGHVRSTITIGVIWGIWHAPVILQGHNYPGHPLAGVLMMIGFTTAASFPLAWSREAAGTIVGPSVLHGVLNAVAALPLVFVAGANPLIGSPAGLLGTVVFVVIGCGLSQQRTLRLRRFASYGETGLRVMASRFERVGFRFASRRG